jgi:hypothetical protein
MREKMKKIMMFCLIAYIVTSAQAVTVDVDIKPATCPNPLNIRSKGLLPVAVLGSEDFDVSTINPASIHLEGVAPIRRSYKDVSTPAPDTEDECECTNKGHDGYLDLILKFNTKEISAAIGAVAVSDGELMLLTLTGEDIYGGHIEGTDCVVINNNSLVAYWSFEASESDVVVDCSGNGLDGAIYGASRSEGALDFDGEDDYVDIYDGSGKISSLSKGTISLWFKFDTYPDGGSSKSGPAVIQPIFYVGDGIGGSTNSSLIIEVGHSPLRENSKLYFTLFTGCGDPFERPIQCFDTRFELVTDTWYHFVAVVGSNFNTGYLDGDELTERKYNFGDSTDSYFLADVCDPAVCWIGKGGFAFFGVDYFDGMIDEVRIFDRPLSGTEIEQLYDD